MNFIQALDADLERPGLVPTRYVKGVPALAQTAFSLPSRVYWAEFYADKAVNLTFAGSNVTQSVLPVAATTALILGPFPVPIDLSRLTVWAIAASSGATLNVWAISR